MKRRFGMWICIICILIVGVSVTRMTKDFVISKGVAASSILNVMDAGNSGVALAGGGQIVSVPEREIAFRMAIPEAVVEDAAEDGASVTTNELAVVPTEAEVFAGESAVVTMEPEAAVAPAAVLSGVEAYSEELFDMEPAEEEIASAQNEAVQETVKSPLDPIVEAQAEPIKTDNEMSAFGVEDFFERFEEAEESSVMLWDSITADNVVAYYAAAEQERVLWDYELNVVYSAVREKMSEEEAEALKHLEVLWMKERDQYAERMAAKSPIMNSQNQNPVYTRAIAEKTKERCYWLVAEYEDVLNRMNPD